MLASWASYNVYLPTHQPTDRQMDGWIDMRSRKVNLWVTPNRVNLRVHKSLILTAFKKWPGTRLKKEVCPADSVRSSNLFSLSLHLFLEDFISSSQTKTLPSIDCPLVTKELFVSIEILSTADFAPLPDRESSSSSNRCFWYSNRSTHLNALPCLALPCSNSSKTKASIRLTNINIYNQEWRPRQKRQAMLPSMEDAKVRTPCTSNSSHTTVMSSSSKGNTRWPLAQSRPCWAVQVSARDTTHLLPAIFLFKSKTINAFNWLQVNLPKTKQTKYCSEKYRKCSILPPTLSDLSN